MKAPRVVETQRLWYLGLGSNVGNHEEWLSEAMKAVGRDSSASRPYSGREGYLREALRRLDATPGLSVQAVSSFYETDPWGDTNQPPFLNAVVAVQCTLDPLQLLAETQRIERELGRQPRRRWGPREIDIDLLLSGDLRVATPELTVPHPLIAERQFVLVPLAELCPDLKLPDGSTVPSLVNHDGSVRLWKGDE
ncbi:MAG: 2-amino-4-hydroxy-6-hydroxymethyldihydropteridine diphosphokinase [Candidatus Zipacnadales bacterium]